MNEGQHPLGTVSAVTGVFATVGHGLCCLPFIGYIAPFVVLSLEAVSLITGFLAYRQAAARGETDAAAMVGLVSGGVAVLMTIAYVLLFSSLIFGYMALVFTLIVFGNA